MLDVVSRAGSFSSTHNKSSSVERKGLHKDQLLSTRYDDSSQGKLPAQLCLNYTYNGNSTVKDILKYGQPAVWAMTISRIAIIELFCDCALSVPSTFYSEGAWFTLYINPGSIAP